MSDKFFEKMENDMHNNKSKRVPEKERKFEKYYLSKNGQKNLATHFIFVGDVHTKITLKVILEHFAQFGEIRNVFAADFEIKGFLTIEYEYMDDAIEAYECCKHRNLIIHGRDIRVEFSRKDPYLLYKEFRGIYEPCTYCGIYIKHSKNKPCEKKCQMCFEPGHTTEEHTIYAQNYYYYQQQLQYQQYMQYYQQNAYQQNTQQLFIPGMINSNPQNNQDMIEDPNDALQN